MVAQTLDISYVGDHEVAIKGSADFTDNGSNPQTVTSSSTFKITVIDQCDCELLSVLQTPAAPMLMAGDISIISDGVAQSTFADKFTDSVSETPNCDPCIDPSYSLMYSDGTEVPADLAILSFDPATGEISVVAQTLLLRYTGLHEVMIQGEVDYTANGSNPQIIDSQSFKINVAAGSCSFCPANHLLPLDETAGDIMPEDMHI